MYYKGEVLVRYQVPTLLKEKDIQGRPLTPGCD